MSTVVSVKGAKPASTSDKSGKKTAGKRKVSEVGGGGKDSKNKKPKKKA